MKKILSYITAFAFAALMFAGCANEPVGADGEGRLVFSMNFGEVTRAEAEAPENIVVKIGNSRGYTHIFEAGDELPEELWLTSGNYFIEVTGGNTEPAINGTLCYAGREDFTISNGEVETVEVMCTVSSTLISVEFDESIPQWLADYSVTIFPDALNNTKTLVFDSENIDATAYMMLAKEQTKVNWAFDGAHKNGSETVAKTGAFESLLPGKHYTVSFKYTEIKGTLVLSFTLTVDDTTIDIGDDIVIVPNLPAVEGQGFDLGLPLAPGERTIKITAASGIKSIVLSGSGFDNFDVVANQTEAATYGITLTQVEGGYEMTLSQMFYDAVEGKVTIEAVDNRDNAQTAAFIKPTATLDAMADGAVWATHATVSGNAPDGGEVKYAYRSIGEVNGDWQYSDMGEITGLVPETTYQVCLQVDGEFASLPLTFTTDVAPQLPNSSFEDASNDGTGSGKIGWYFYPGAKTNIAEKFWDCGNAGTASVMALAGPRSVTTSIAAGHTGKGVEMRSQFVGLGSMGAFAAGNLYSGDFGLTRANLSNPSGTVHFGQPFTARPTAMSFYYKATTGSVDYVKTADGQPLNIGDSDRYRVYIALVDGADFNPQAEGADGGNHWHTVDTADMAGTAPDFDNDTRVIAFGSYDSDADVAEWTKQTIEIEYRAINRIPTHIVVVASASMYGDFFTGSTSSVMTIDDFELVY